MNIFLKWVGAKRIKRNFLSFRGWAMSLAPARKEY